MLRRDAVWCAIGILAGPVAVLAMYRQPLFFLVGLSALAAVLALHFANGSLSKLASLGMVLALGAPLIPALQGSLGLQTLVIAVGAGLLSLLAGAEASHRNFSVTAPVCVATLLVALSLVAVVAGDSSMPRALFAAATGTLLSLGVIVGQAATPDERGSILRSITFLAVVTAILAIVEWVRQAPIYEFTAFQTHDNASAAFRASSIYGHPLILATFMCAVALANFAKGPVDGPWWYRLKLVSIGLPLIAALASGSRSIVWMGAVGIVTLVLVRQRERRVSKGLVVTAGALGLLGLLYALRTGSSALAQRFGELSLQEQSVRASGLRTVLKYTDGLENLVGSGPRAIAAEVGTDVESLSFGAVDNQFWTMYADYGLIGAALLVVLVALPLRAIRDRRVAFISLPAVVGAIVITSSMIVVDSLAWPPLALIFAFGVGSSLARTEPENRGSGGLSSKIPETSSRGYGVENAAK